MAKCTHCGRKGLFLKVDSKGHCADCKIELERKDRLSMLDLAIANKQKIYDEELAKAKTQAHAQLEADHARLTAECATLKDQQLRAVADRDATLVQVESARSELDAIIAKAEKLKPMAKSIKAAFDSARQGNVHSEAKSIDTIALLHELVPDPDLNCLTVKELGTQYRSIRKQINDVYTAYEVELAAEFKKLGAYYSYTSRMLNVYASLYKMLILALESEFKDIISTLRFGTLDAAVSSVHKLISNCRAIVLIEPDFRAMFRRFFAQIESLYLDAVTIEHEYYVQRERAREEQRALKEQMRQEAEERKRLEAERKKVEAEESKYLQEIKRITEQMAKAHDSELEALRARLAEVEQMVSKVEERKAEIINLQNGKAGTVYIISNIGSFGDNVFKVGMTRRLEPQDRVTELGDASVPFPFDVHSFIFSQDAPALESALHKELNDRRVNKVNLRKEFFRVSVEELQQIVERIDPTAPFRVTALAEQYRQSLSIDTVPSGPIELADSEDDE